MTSTIVAFQRSKLSSTSSPRAAPKSEGGASAEESSPRQPPRLVFFDTATGQSVGQSGHTTDSLVTGISGGKLDIKAGPVSARGMRKEEFEHLESIISNPRRAGSRNETEKLDGYEARRECFRACASLCVAMRMPCSETVSQELTELPYGGSRKRGGTAVMADSSGVRTVIREYASEQRVRAIKQALWKVLRKPKPAETTPKLSWRDKFRDDDEEVDDLAGFMVKDPSEHSPRATATSEAMAQRTRPFPLCSSTERLAPAGPKVAVEAAAHVCPPRLARADPCAVVFAVQGREKGQREQRGQQGGEVALERGESGWPGAGAGPIQEGMRRTRE